MCGATTGISDEDAHRFSRASRISLVLSDCEDARKRLSHSLERRRVSAKLRVLARCSASWISPCSDRPCALAADFKRDNTSSSRSRIKKFAMITPIATISHRYHDINRGLSQVSAKSGAQTWATRPLLCHSQPVSGITDGLQKPSRAQGRLHQRSLEAAVGFIRNIPEASEV